jgi:hypothetical protein
MRCAEAQFHIARQEVHYGLTRRMNRSGAQFVCISDCRCVQTAPRSALLARSRCCRDLQNAHFGAAIWLIIVRHRLAVSILLADSSFVIVLSPLAIVQDRVIRSAGRLERRGSPGRNPRHKLPSYRLSSQSARPRSAAERSLATKAPCAGARPPRPGGIQHAVFRPVVQSAFLFGSCPAQPCSDSFRNADALLLRNPGSNRNH